MMKTKWAFLISKNFFLFLGGGVITNIAFLYWIMFGMDIFCIIELLLVLVFWGLFLLLQISFSPKILASI